MGTTIIHERASLTSQSKVDRKAGRISEVKLLGRESLNGRRYTDRAMEKAAKLYPGKPIYKDHTDNPGEVRGALEEIGVVAEAYFDRERDGVFGPVDCFLESEGGRRMLEQAEKAPHLFGMSHDVEANLSTVNGITEVADIVSVTSVDAVKRPATTKTLHESETQTMKLSKFVESVKPADPFHAILTEAAKTRGDFEVQEKATPQSVVQAMLAEQAKPAPPKQEPVKESTLSVTAETDKVLEAIKPTLENLAKEVKALGEWRKAVEVKESALAVLQESDIEPRPELLKELHSLQTREAMQERVALWPDYVRDPSNRPLVESLRESEDDDSTAKFSEAKCFDRWGIKTESAA